MVGTGSARSPTAHSRDVPVTISLLLLLLSFLTPVLSSQGMKKYAVQYKKVQKPSWNEHYSSSSSFTKQSCSKIIIIIKDILYSASSRDPQMRYVSRDGSMVT